MAGAEFAGEMDGAGDVDARRSAEQQPFLNHQIEHDRQRLLVGDLVGEINRRAFKIGGDPVLADALGDGGARALEFARGVERVQRRAQRVSERDLDVWVALFERHADASQRPAAADRADEAMNFAAEIVIDLRPGRFIMAAPVGDIVELVRPDGAVGFGLGERIGEAPRIANVIVGIGIGDGGNLDQLGAGKAQHVLLFLRLSVGDDDHGAIAERARHHRDADARVAGRAFDDHSARAQGAARDRVIDHRQRRAILDRPARVHELRLAENRASRRLGRGAKLNEGRAADRGDNIAYRLHRGPLR